MLNGPKTQMLMSRRSPTYCFNYYYSLLPWWELWKGNQLLKNWRIIGKNAHNLYKPIFNPTALSNPFQSPEHFVCRLQMLRLLQPRWTKLLLLDWKRSTSLAQGITWEMMGRVTMKNIIMNIIIILMIIDCVGGSG